MYVYQDKRDLIFNSIHTELCMPFWISFKTALKAPGGLHSWSTHQGFCATPEQTVDDAGPPRNFPQPPGKQKKKNKGYWWHENKQIFPRVPCHNQAIPSDRRSASPPSSASPYSLLVWAVGTDGATGCRPTTTTVCSSSLTFFFSRFRTLCLRQMRPFSM